MPFIPFYIFLRYYKSKQLHLYNNKTIGFAGNTFRPRWLSLWHANDEALQGLKSLRTLKFDVFSKYFAAGPISLMSVFILPVLVLLLVNSSVTMIDLYEFAKYNGYLGVTYELEVEGENEKLEGNGKSIYVNIRILIDIAAHMVAKSIDVAAHLIANPINIMDSLKSDLGLIIAIFFCCNCSVTHCSVTYCRCECVGKVD